MSAFEVDRTHIDALLTAGLDWSTPLSELRWLAPIESHPEYEHAFQSGTPWGPTADAVYRDCARTLTRETADRTGAMLVAQNRASVDFRYAEDELEYVYTFSKLPTRGGCDPVVVVGALSCYEYQACETPDWRQTEAYAFCEALRARAVERMVARLGGRSTWEITDRNIYIGGAK